MTVLRCLIRLLFKLLLLLLSCASFSPILVTGNTISGSIFSHWSFYLFLIFKIHLFLFKIFHLIYFDHIPYPISSLVLPSSRPIQLLVFTFLSLSVSLSLCVSLCVSLSVFLSLSFSLSLKDYIK